MEIVMTVRSDRSFYMYGGNTIIYKDGRWKNWI